MTRRKFSLAKAARPRAQPRRVRIGLRLRGTRFSAWHSQTLGTALTVVEAHAPGEYPAAFEEMREAEAQGLVIVSAPDFSRDAAILADVARAAGLPTICEWREMAER